MRHEEFISFLHETGHGTLFRETKLVELKVDGYRLVIYKVESEEYLTFRIKDRRSDDYVLFNHDKKIILAPDLPDSTWRKIIPLLTTGEESVSS